VQTKLAGSIPLSIGLQIARRTTITFLLLGGLSPPRFAFGRLSQLTAGMRRLRKFDGTVEERAAAVTKLRRPICEMAHECIELRLRIAFVPSNDFVPKPPISFAPVFEISGDQIVFGGKTAILAGSLKSISGTGAKRSIEFSPFSNFRHRFEKVKIRVKRPGAT
jgi:hypothetical protein